MQTRAVSPITTRPCNTTRPTPIPGTIAPRPSCGSATRKARSRISGRHWSCAPICRRRVRRCWSSVSNY